MGPLLVVILVLPAVVGVLAWWAPPRVGAAATVGAGAATFACALALVPAAGSGVVTALGGQLRADALSVVFLVATAFLYATTAVFAVGYLRHPAPPHYRRRFWAGFNLFCWAMAVAPIVANLALLWVAIEITTVVSALLVAIDDTDGAAEASWKYLLIASMGLGIALFATVVLYAAGTVPLGAGHAMVLPTLLGAAHRLPPTMVRLAYVLAVLGFGTKMGLAPVHTWLPDAHAEAPTPVSALLSGSLLAISFYAILRYYQVAAAVLGPTFPREVLLGFGLASLALAALYLAGQRDLKRLLAYSSVEHMGILAIGMSFQAPIAVVGVLLHVLAHAAAKGTAFFGSGSVARKLGSRDLWRVRGGISLLPWTGPALILAVLALAAMPPFGIFRSEFLIVAGGLRGSGDAAAAVLVALVTVAALGLTWSTGQAMWTPTPAGTVRGEVSAWMVAAMVAGLLVLVVLGVHPPAQLGHLLARAAAELGTGR